MSASASAFALLHPRLQEQLYQMRWTELRPIQVEAIRALLSGNRHVLLSAQTAGGKTEAAFLPILSRIADEPRGSVRVLYVSPLKALINDQFRRLEELCERVEIPVHRWHGDVGQAARRSLLEDPSGVLLITPESIEALLINRPHAIGELFSGLRYVVVDELHSFIGTERGAHLRSLLCRVVSRSSGPVRFVALSATIGDPQAAARWLCPHESEPSAIIEGGREKDIKYQLRGYLRPAEQLLTPDDVDLGGPEDPPVTDDDERLAQDLLKAYFGKTVLVFANSRAKLEYYADLVRRRAETQGLPNRFRVHHGSLSKGEREDTEEALRSDVPTVTFCSSTLELGIDVGNVVEVGQIGAPWSVSSLAQRLGRSGRREGEPSVLRLYIEENEPTEHSSILDKLHLQLLQGIAMTELMLERWCEPPDADRLHLSTLVQQILSLIAEKGGAAARGLWSTLVARGGFPQVTQEMFVDVLRSLGAGDWIEQTTEGDLILGLKGEKLVRRFEFYSAFQSDEELRVISQGRYIGSVASVPGLAADGYLILAGRRWKVVSVDEDRKEILVEPSRGGRLPHFSGQSGADLHPRVMEKMREVLFDTRIPVYLDPVARGMLLSARSVAAQANLAQSQFVREGGTTHWYTWAGSRVQRTLFALGAYRAGLKVRDDEIALAFERVGEEEIRAGYRALLADLPSAEELAAGFAVKAQEKYESLLRDALQAATFARSSLDLEAARRIIELL